MALEDRVELDVDDALRRIDTLEEALQSSATRFSVALAEALDVLSGVSITDVDAGTVTSAIDAAVDAADTSTVVEGDAGAVTGEIDAAVDAADSTVLVDAETGGISDEITQAVNDADTTVELDVDESAAVDALDNLGTAAGEAGGGLSSAGLGVAQLSAASEAATGSLAGLQGGLAATHPAGAAAAAGIAAVGGAALALFHAALDSDTATRRFNSALGEMADEVEGINIDGFADSLGELAEKAGSDDEAMRLAAARIADLGNSAGAAAPDIADTAKNILLLATRATVMNPTLGDAGDVADRMTNAFARGGRALRPFGISLDAASIKARAVADAGGDAAAATDGFALSAAGAAIVAERLGGHLKSDIVEGAKGTEISLRSLREQFKNTLEDLGKPLLQPIIESIRAGQPILLDLARVLGELAEAILPVVLSAFEAGGPIIHAVATAAEGLLAVVGPLLNLIASIPTPFLTAVGAMVAMRLAIAPLITMLQTGLATAAIGVQGAFAALLSPMGAVSVAVGLLAVSWANHAKAQAESNARVREGAAAFEDEATAVSDAIAAIAEKRIPENQVDDINRLGLSFREVGDLAREGSTGFDDFIDQMVLAGEISPNVGRALQEIGLKSGNLTTLLRAQGITSGDLMGQNLGLVNTFRSLAAEEQESAKTALRNMLAHDQLSGAQERAARAALANKDGTVDYVGVLDDVKPSADGAAEGTDGLTQSLQDQTQASKDAADALNALLDAQIGYLDSTVAAENASRSFGENLTDVKDKTAALGEAIRAHSAGSKEATEAQSALDESIRKARDSALQSAEAQLRLRDDQAAASGTSLTAAQRQDVFRTALQNAAAQADGPTRAAIQALIVKMDQLPAVKTTQINVDTFNANAKLDAFLRKLNQGALTARNFEVPGTRLPGSMAGGSFSTGREGQWHAFGEAGREVAFIGPNTSVAVRTAGQTAGQQQPGPASAVIEQNISVTQVANDPEATAFAVAARIGEQATR